MTNSTATRGAYLRVNGEPLCRVLAEWFQRNRRGLAPHVPGVTCRQLSIAEGLEALGQLEASGAFADDELDCAAGSCPACGGTP